MTPGQGGDPRPLPPPDCFWGWDASSRHVHQHGLARAWRAPKALAGNTHPGACLPFSALSVVPYSGAYPTGHGVNDASYSGRPRRLLESHQAHGFAHFQQTGTGAIGAYYNYLLVWPPMPAGMDPFTLAAVRDEHAEPGLHACTLGDPGTRVEVTVGPATAFYRFTGAPAEAAMALDPWCGGLRCSTGRFRPAEAQLAPTAPGAYEGLVLTQENKPLWLCAEVSGRAVAREERCVSLGDATRQALLLRLEGDGPVELRVSFSVVDAADAARLARRAATRSFDEALHRARRAWRRRLSRVTIDAPPADEHARVFASAVYQQHRKPAALPASGLVAPRFTDYATLWDTWRTQFPWILLTAPEDARRVLVHYLARVEKTGELPMALLWKDPPTGFDDQGLGLAVMVACEAHWLGVVDLARENADHLAPLARALDAAWSRQPATPSTPRERVAFLDLCLASHCLAAVASLLPATRAAAKREAKRASRWPEAFDPATSLLSVGDYYEGGRWNYSMRWTPGGGLPVDNARRVALMDQFFGFAPPPGEDFQPFEGLNNETDMEAPFLYHFASRPDRAADVVRAARAEFRPGPGGLPGNDDSGGLSGWLAWASAGLFPATGMGLYLAVPPAFAGIGLRTPHGRLVIRREGDAPYLRDLVLDGVALGRSFLTAREVAAGGELLMRTTADAAESAALRAPTPDDAFRGWEWE